MEHDYTEPQAWADLGSLGLPFFRTGSREICSPPPLDTDVDFVVLNAGFQKSVAFEENGFSQATIEDRERYGFADFLSYRRGEVNLLVVDTWGSFRAWKVATAAAKQMNIKDKSKRIALFQGVLYGNW